MSDGKEEEARKLNRFHLKIALHHLRQIIPDLIPPSGVLVYTEVLKFAELLDVHMKPRKPSQVMEKKK